MCYNSVKRNTKYKILKRIVWVPDYDWLNRVRRRCTFSDIARLRPHLVFIMLHYLKATLAEGNVFLCGGIDI